MPDQAQHEWITRVLGVAPTQRPVATQDGLAFSAARGQVAQDMQVALKANPEHRTALSAIWSAIEQYQQAGDIARAQSALDRLQKSLARLTAATAPTMAERMGITPGLVAERRMQFEALINEKIQASQKTAAEDVVGFTAPFDTVIEEPQSVVAAMDSYIAGLCARITADLLAAAAGGDPTALRERVAAWQADLTADAALAAITEAADVFDLDDPADTLADLFDDILSGLETMAP
jgi:hypothetical protein